MNQTALATHLLAARQAAGLSLTAAAAQCGVSRTYLYALEQGQADPTVGKLAAIATGYGTTVGALLDCDGAEAEVARTLYVAVQNVRGAQAQPALIRAWEQLRTLADQLGPRWGYEVGRVTAT